MTDVDDLVKQAQEHLARALQQPDPIPSDVEPTSLALAQIEALTGIGYAVLALVNTYTAANPPKPSRYNPSR